MTAKSRVMRNNLPEQYEDIPELTDADLARVTLRINGTEASREAFAVAIQDKLGKQRVSIMLDASVIAFFKAKAGERGYQTLINQALHDAMRGEQLEATIRKVIREELHSTG